MEPVEIPQAEGMTPGEAKAALDKVHAAAACNVEHPYSNPRHPQHRAMLDATAALHAIHATREDAELGLMELAMRDGLAAQDAKKDMLADDIDAEIATLHGLGYEGEAPADPQPHHLTGLRMQRLHAEQAYDALIPLMEKELKSLRASAETIQQFQDFVNNADADTDLRDAVTEKLVAWIHAANVARAAGKPKPSTPNMEDGQ